MLTIACLLALGALVSAIVSMMGQCPLSVPVLLLAVVELLHCIPLR